MLFDVCILNIECVFVHSKKIHYANFSQCGDNDFFKYGILFLIFSKMFNTSVNQILMPDLIIV